MAIVPPNRIRFLAYIGTETTFTAGTDLTLVMDSSPKSFVPTKVPKIYTNPVCDRSTPRPRKKYSNS